MDFTQKILTEKNEVMKTQESFLNEEGVNDTREIELTFKRIAEAALLHAYPEGEINSDENLIKRFELFQKIQEPENVKLSKEERILLVDCVKSRFGYDVVLLYRLLKALK